MNPMFVVIVIGVAILIWWSLGGIFPFIGNFFKEEFNDMKDSIESDEEEDDEER